MKELAIKPVTAIEAVDMEIDVQRVVSQTIAIQQVLKSLMQPEVHYGVIPGTDKNKPTLLQPGADKLCMLFRLRPKYLTTVEIRPDYYAVQVRCRLLHIPTRQIWGEGLGAANSREARYLNQSTAKACPMCGKAAIRKGSEQYGGGWYCNTKALGCGAKYKDGDKRIEENAVTQLNADKVFDLHNTILKIACKRAKVAAVLTATAASDIFTQDLEDLEDIAVGLEERAAGAHHEPRANGNGGPPPAPKKASIAQIRDLNVALREQGVAAGETLSWINGMREGQPPIAAITDMTPDEADRLIKDAKAGYMPGAR